MLHLLSTIEAALPALLLEEDAWDSLWITYEHPHVERLWREWNGSRLYLHRILPCTEAQALFHPHPWASAMRVHGTYLMLMGYGAGDTPPPVHSRLELAAGSAYEMVDPDAWHAVMPRETPALSLMVTGTPWHRWSPKPGGSLGPLTPEARAKLFADFRALYPSHPTLRRPSHHREGSAS